MLRLGSLGRTSRQSALMMRLMKLAGRAMGWRATVPAGGISATSLMACLLWDFRDKCAGQGLRQGTTVKITGDCRNRQGSPASATLTDRHNERLAARKKPPAGGGGAGEGLGMGRDSAVFRRWPILNSKPLRTILIRGLIALLAILV